jgi:hypothetical protein
MSFAGLILNLSSTLPQIWPQTKDYARPGLVVENILEQNEGRNEKRIQNKERKSFDFNLSSRNFATKFGGIDRRSTVGLSDASLFFSPVQFQIINGIESAAEIT